MRFTERLLNTQLRAMCCPNYATVLFVNVPFWVGFLKY